MCTVTAWCWSRLPHWMWSCIFPQSPAKLVKAQDWNILRLWHKFCYVAQWPNWQWNDLPPGRPSLYLWTPWPWLPSTANSLSWLRWMPCVVTKPLHLPLWKVSFVLLVMLFCVSADMLNSTMLMGIKAKVYSQQWISVFEWACKRYSRWCTE